MIPIRDRIPSKSYPIITYSIIAVNIAAFLLEMAQPDVEQFIFNYGLVPARFSVPGIASRFTAGSQVLSLFTFMFLHGGFLHIIGNMWFLYIFGDNVEDRMGPVRYLVFYLLCGWASGAVHLLTNWTSAMPTIGASGAIAGVMGAYFILYPRSSIITLIPIFFIPYFIDIPAYIFLGIWFVFQFFYSGQSGPEGGATIAWTAHVGGFIFGLLTVKLFSRLPATAVDEKLTTTFARTSTPRLQTLHPAREEDLDLYGSVTLTPKEARNGTRKMISVPGDMARRGFLVTIPPGTANGTRIRLRGLGRKGDDRTGDVYLDVRIEG